MEFINWILENWSELLNAVVALLAAAVALAMLIPGDEPEAFLQKVVDFLKKFSKK
jgi:hypothetical protein